ncbi:putative Polycomb group protein ASXL2 [Protopterus annectens]|uniref:putative Polycomb group protein ASXL2 n=1 Tax=Protopterus annectens TaxID=7888 RepID=UPI001CFB3582|nr:putative Polycomb group protein ASXL2 [Protopterus annectens]
MREKSRKKKGRTWAEAAKTALEKYPNTPMSHKEILHVIQKEGLKEISGTSPLACLNAMLHINSRGDEGIFYKVPGRMGVYALKKDGADGVTELSEGSEESSDSQSDSQSTENSSSNSIKEVKRCRWTRKVSSRLSSQPSSPQSGCPSPSIPASKVISSSQQHSKKAVKQALKQQQQQKKQQQQQHRRAGMPVSTNQHIILKTVKAATDQAASKTGQLKRAKCAEIDVETPDSILVNTNLRALINKHTFSVLPVDYQQQLLLLLPEVDRQVGGDGYLKLNSSALNNEFFTSAAQGWKQRLAEGEFTPEMQQRIRQETEKEKKVEPWKEHFFENYYGQNSGLTVEDSKQLTAADSNTEEFNRTLVEHHSPQASVLSTKETYSPQVSVPNAEETYSPQVSVPNAEETYSPQVSVLSAEDTFLSTISSTDSTEPNSDECCKEKTEEIVQKSSVETAEEQGAETLNEQTDSLRPSVICISETAVSEVVDLPEEKVEALKPEEYGSSSSELCKELKTSTEVTEVNKELDSSFSSVEDFLSESPGKTENAESEVPAKAEDKYADLHDVEKGTVAPDQIGVITEGLKRKSSSQEESLPSPEKRPRVPEEQQKQLFQTPSASFLPIKEQTTEQKVPPLKIPVSRISSTSTSPCQVSTWPPFPAPVTSPGRTGARTLADIKAKAQLAKAQRAAAAAAAAAASAGRTIPGPGPGGGAGIPGEERTSPASSDYETGWRGSVLELPGTGSRGSAGGAIPFHTEAPPRTATQSKTQMSSDSSPGTQLLQTSVLQFRASAPEGFATSVRQAEEPTLTVTASDVTTTVKLATMGVMDQNASQSNFVASQYVTDHISLKQENLTRTAACLITSTTESSGTSRNDKFVFVTDASNRDAIRNLSTATPKAAVALPALGASSVIVTSVSVMPVTSQANVTVISSLQAPACSTLPVVSSLNTQGVPSSGSRPTVRTSASIPANNPLVTQLLQGKEIPLEHILPKPFTKLEMQSTPLSSSEKEKMPITATLLMPVTVENSTRGLPRERQPDPFLLPFYKPLSQNGEQLLHQRSAPLVMRGQGRTTIQQSQSKQEIAGKLTDDQILHTFFRKVQDRYPLPSLQPTVHGLNSIALQYEDTSASPRFILGFMGRRASVKPAVSGHYLLNISTYGRGSESFRRTRLMSTEMLGGVSEPADVPKTEHREYEVDTDGSNCSVSDAEDAETMSEHGPVVMTTEEKTCEDSDKEGPEFHTRDSALEQTIKNELRLNSTTLTQETVEKKVISGDSQYDSTALAKDLIHLAQASMSNVLSGHMMHGDSELYRTIMPPTDAHQHCQMMSQQQQQHRLYGNPNQLTGPVYGGTFNVSTSPAMNHMSSSSKLGYGQVSSNAGNVMFSVTVTAIPANPTVNPNHDQSISVQAFTEDGSMGDPPSKCCCRLKAMIMCRGCGAFCHDDCIGPSKLCVSCLVVR